MSKKGGKKQKSRSLQYASNRTNLTEDQALEHEFAVRVLAEMRKGESFDEAFKVAKQRYGARNIKTPGRQLTREILDPALTKGYAENKQGRGVNRLRAKREDNLIRRTTIVNAQGGVEQIYVRGNKQAERMGDYWAAVNEYVRTGDPSRLDKFRGKSIRTADGQVIQFETDPNILDYMAMAGELTDIVVSG